MKITFFIGGLSGGGAERVVSSLANYLTKNHEITILTLSNDPATYFVDKEIKRYCLTRNQDSNNYVQKNIKRIGRLKSFLKSHKTDVFVVFLPITINLLLFFRYIIKAPIIVSERCDPYTRYDKSFVNRWIMKTLYPKADGFVFQTKESKEYYDNVLNNQGIVIPNAINHPEKFIMEDKRSEKKIISAGRLTEQKNFSMLLDAFSIISKRYPDYQLVIYGEGPQKEILVNKAEKLKIADQVYFPGYVKNLREKILESHIFVLTSNYEGMPNVLMEAMSLGKPVISTDCAIGGPKFLIENGQNGLLVPTNHSNKLVEALEKIIDDAEFAKKLGENAFNINDRLAPDKIYSIWEKYIEEIVNKEE